MADFIPSAQQSAFFDWVDTGTGSATMIAVAGAGKTTTILHGISRMKGRVFLGMFNKSIAKEAREKAEDMGIMRPGFKIGTMHSAGFSAWRYLNPSVQVDEDKVKNITKRLMAREPRVERAMTFISKVVSFAKQLLIMQDPDPETKMLDVLDHFSLANDLPEDIEINEALDWAKKVFWQSHRECAKIIDFDDMIYAPVAFNARMYQNDWVLMDEAQDTNPARRALMKKMLAPKGRMVAVGDPWQAIYGFTGADADAMSLIEQEFNCTRLELTTTYRCPKDVVKYVQQWVSHIHAHSSAPDGMVAALDAEYRVDGKTLPWYMVNRPDTTDAILCRNTAPIVMTAYGMLRNNIPCRVEGRDIGKGLVSLVKRWKARDLDALEVRLEKYLETEKEKAKELDKPRIAENAKDKVETLKVFIEKTRDKGLNTVKSLIEEIESLFQDEVKGVTVLSTLHKAKGREWPSVYWLQAPPVQRAMKEWEERGEICCNYVAGTRAKDKLYLVD